MSTNRVNKITKNFYWNNKGRFIRTLAVVCNRVTGIVKCNWTDDRFTRPTGCASFSYSLVENGDNNFLREFTGYAAEIPGHPRHSMVIDSGNGVYNLLVRNVTISDDAQYQCQVSPGPATGSKPIRSSARLTVLSELPCPIRAVFESG